MANIVGQENAPSGDEELRTGPAQAAEDLSARSLDASPSYEEVAECVEQSASLLRFMWQGISDAIDSGALTEHRIALYRQAAHEEFVSIIHAFDAFAGRCRDPLRAWSLRGYCHDASKAFDYPACVLSRLGKPFTGFMRDLQYGLEVVEDPSRLPGIIKDLAEHEPLRGWLERLAAARDEPARVQALFAEWRDTQYSYEDIAGYVGLNRDDLWLQVFASVSPWTKKARMAEPLLQPYQYLDIVGLQVDKFLQRLGVEGVDFLPRVAPGCEDLHLPQGVLTLTDCVILPLMQNSLEALAGQREKILYLEISRSSASWELRLRDNGPGFKQGDLAGIFEGRSGSGEQLRGRGLGLARQYLSLAFSGTAEISAERAPRGACFLIRLSDQAVSQD